MTREATQTHCPEDVLGWIPWYGDGSLSEAEEGAVAAHAAECAECRAEIEMIAGALFEVDADLPDPDIAFESLKTAIAARAEAAAEAESDEAAGSLDGEIDVSEPDVHVVSYESMDDLAQLAEWALEDAPGEGASPVNAGISATSATTEPASAVGGQLIEGPWSRSSVWAAAAACVLVSLGALAGALFSNGSGAPTAGADAEMARATAPNLSDPTYDLATAGPNAEAVAGRLFDVVFRDSATVTEISSVLRGAGAEIISGPSPLGVYRVRLNASDLTPGAADAAVGGLEGLEAEFLSRLRNDGGGLAVFAEAVP